MKNLLVIVVFGFIMTLLVGCNIQDDSLKPVTTTVEGRVFDPERNRPFPNVNLEIDQVCLCYIVVESANTDGNGRYQMTYDHEPGNAYFIPRPLEPPVYPKEFERTLLVSGAPNIVDFEYWTPLIFKLNLKVSNNFSPPLRIYSTDEDDFYNVWDFPRSKILETNIDTILYVHAKPNALMRLSFNYNDPTTRYHERLEFNRTARQDTIELSYVIDCNEF